MPLSFAAVMPHGGALIPGVEETDENASAALTQAMESIAAAGAAQNLDAIVIATPHGVRVDDAHSVAMSQTIAGELGPFSLEAPIDEKLSIEILSAAQEEKLPCLGILYGGQTIPMPMDWGAFVPLWFFSQNGPLPPVAVICPTRNFGFDSLVRLGSIIASQAERSSRNIGLIASADQAHAHTDTGPYGYHPSAKEFDKLIVELTERGHFDGYIRLEERLIEEALPDSPWQLAMLTGAFTEVPFKVASVTYDCPSYFGMMCALFERQAV